MSTRSTETLLGFPALQAHEPHHASVLHFWPEAWSVQPSLWSVLHFQFICRLTLITRTVTQQNFIGKGGNSTLNRKGCFCMAVEFKYQQAYSIADYTFNVPLQALQTAQMLLMFSYSSDPLFHFLSHSKTSGHLRWGRIFVNVCYKIKHILELARLQMRPKALNWTSTAPIGSSNIFFSIGNSSASLNGSFIESVVFTHTHKHTQTYR